MKPIDSEPNSVPEVPASTQGEYARECDRLMNWLRLTGYDVESISRLLGIKPNTLRVAIGRRRLPDAFRWRFLRHFGTQVADIVLSPPDLLDAEDGKGEEKTLQVP